MLSLAEYRAAAAELQALAEHYDELIAEAVPTYEAVPRLAAIKVARDLSEQYQQDYRVLLDNTLQEVAQNAVEYYSNKLAIEVDVPAIVQEVVEQQYGERYYGATLNQRLTVNNRALVRRIVQSAGVGPEALASVFSKSVPFGAQVSVDKRVLLGTAAKIENDVAKRMADVAGVRLVRWTLSPRHKILCECDDLANHIDSAVVRYMQENNINENPRGMYFVEDLPQPPHPNCQCEYAMVVGRRTQAITSVRRTVQKVRNILRRLRRG